MDSIKLITAPMVATRGLEAAVQPNQSRVQIPLHEVWQQGGNVFFFSNRTVLRHVQHKLPTHSRILSTKLQNQLMGLEQFPRPQTADTARWKVKKIETRRRMWTILAGGGVGETTESVSTSDEEILEDLKQALMRAVSNTNRGKDTTYQQRQAILTLIEKLEELNPTRDPVDSPLFSGRWALLYTSPIDEKTADKYAGTEEGPFLARVKPAAFGSVRQTRSTQVLDTLGGTAQNIADFKFFGLNGSLNIKGSVIKAAPMSKGSIRVDVTFESFVLKIGNWTSPSISLSWINPKGWIDTTFLDKGMRVGRGDKGSIFVAVPMKEA